jgi:hypothetical protein
MTFEGHLQRRMRGFVAVVLSLMKLRFCFVVGYAPGERDQNTDYHEQR